MLLDWTFDLRKLMPNLRANTGECRTAGKSEFSVNEIIFLVDYAQMVCENGINEAHYSKMLSMRSDFQGLMESPSICSGFCRRV